MAQLAFARLLTTLELLSLLFVSVQFSVAEIIFEEKFDGNLFSLSLTLLLFIVVGFLSIGTVLQCFLRYHPSLRSTKKKKNIQLCFYS